LRNFPENPANPRGGETPMRTKAQILDDAVRAKPAPGSWDCVASLHERLTIEVLIDLRDVIQQRLISIDNTLLKYIIPK